MYHDRSISISVKEFFRTELVGKVLWFKFSWREEGRVMEREGGKERGKEGRREGGKGELEREKERGRKEGEREK